MPDWDLADLLTADIEIERWMHRLPILARRHKCPFQDRSPERTVRHRCSPGQIGIGVEEIEELVPLQRVIGRLKSLIKFRLKLRLEVGRAGVWESVQDGLCRFALATIIRQVGVRCITFVPFTLILRRPLAQRGQRYADENRDRGPTELAFSVVPKFTCAIQSSQPLDDTRKWRDFCPEDGRRQINARFDNLCRNHNLAENRRAELLSADLAAARTIRWSETRMQQDQVDSGADRRVWLEAKREPPLRRSTVLQMTSVRRGISGGESSQAPKHLLMLRSRMRGFHPYPDQCPGRWHSSFLVARRR